MEIKSKGIHEQLINPESSITFPKGIPGFEQQTHFQLYQQEGSKIVYLLQSTDNDSTIAFSVAHPSHFHINYHFILSDEEEAALGLESINDLLILLILHFDQSKENPENHPIIKGSLKSPLLINTKRKLGIQKVLCTIEQSITLTEKSNEIEVSEMN